MPACRILIGFVAAVLTGSFLSLLLGFMSIFLGVSKVALGFVLSLHCRDLAYFLGNSYNRLHGSEVLPMPIPFLSDIPFIGPTLFNQNIDDFFPYSCAIFKSFYRSVSV
jgi:simple sugar transport system permease protein